MPTFEYILCIMAQLLIKNGHQKDISYDEIGLCAHNLSIILGSVFITQLRRPLWSLKEKLDVIFNYYNFCISTLILKLEMII